MVTGGTPVMMITHQHRLNCILPTGGQRLQDILNVRTTEYLNIVDVQVFHSLDTDVCVANLPNALISKSSVCLVVIPIGKHEAPEQRMLKRIKKNLYDTFLSVLSFEVEGTIHLINSIRSPRLTDCLINDLKNFFPITNATISQVNSIAKPLNAPVVIVNKTYLGVFSLCDPPRNPKNLLT
jgi:hypothetical protein